MGLMGTLKDKFNETGLADQLCSHLNGCGLKARVVDRKGSEAMTHSGILRTRPAPIGCVKVEGCNIDFVEMYRQLEDKGGFKVSIGDIGLSAPPSLNYEYVAVSRFDVGEEKDLRAEIDYLTKGLLKKEVVDFRWKGGVLADRLNQDVELKEMLKTLGMPCLDVSCSKKDGSVEISRGHVAAKTLDLSVGKHDFPSSQILAVYDRIFGVVGTMRTRIAR
jgi:hypothetical protein